MPSAEFRRAFLALWPAPALAAQFHAQGEGFSGQRLLPEDLHLTLAFLGDLDRCRFDALGALVAGLTLPVCTLEIDRLAFWPHNRILWTGPSQLPDVLQTFVTALHARLRAAGFALEARDFQAHITLLRKAQAVSAGDCGDLAQPLRWPLECWSLAVASPVPGACRYARLASWGSSGCGELNQ